MGSEGTVAAKAPWQSKTIILNTIGALVAAVAVFYPGASVVSDFLKLHAAEIGIVWSVANIVLRAVTKDAISLGD